MQTERQKEDIVGELCGFHWKAPESEKLQEVFSHEEFENKTKICWKENKRGNTEERKEPWCTLVHDITQRIYIVNQINDKKSGNREMLLSTSQGKPFVTSFLR